MSSTRYHVLGLGGTFDHFHKGHEQFILFAARLARHLQIGITTLELTHHKPLSELCESYETRVKAVTEFCQKHELSFEIIPLYDVYGPTLEDSSIEALCVTEETLPGAKRINRARAGRRLSMLPIHVCAYYPNELGRPLHSLDIRLGSVNRNGRVYELLFKKTLTLKKSSRQFFAKPQGVLRNAHPYNLTGNIFVVGDVTLEYFIQHRLPYQLGIYDKKRNRVAVHSSAIDTLRPDITTKNKPGTLSPQLVKALKLALQEHAKHLFVKGEEDLAVVALVLLLPLQAKIYYGQPNSGVVELTVTEETKDAMYQVLTA